MTVVNNIRRFSGADAYMVNQCSIAVGLLKQDLASFTNYDYTIDATFVTDFETKIGQAFTVVSDSVAIIPQKNATAAVLKAVADGKHYYDDIIYFVTKKAFRGNKVIAREFGVGGYKEACNSSMKFALFLETLYQKAVVYQSQLEAAGCSTALINNLGKAVKTLSSANLSQALLKSSRPVLTADRIAVLNECYRILGIVNAAAGNIYRHDAARKQQFVYHPARKGRKVVSKQTMIDADTADEAISLPTNEERTLSNRLDDVDRVLGLGIARKSLIGSRGNLFQHSFENKESIDFATKGEGYFATTTVEDSFYDIEADW